MAQPDPPPHARKKPVLGGLPSRFVVGSVSEENSEDEAAGRPNGTREGKETPRSASPASSASSLGSDSTNETGFDSSDSAPNNLRSEPPPTSGQNPGPPTTSGQHPCRPRVRTQDPRQPRVRTQDPHRPRVRTQDPHQPQVRTPTNLGSEPRTPTDLGSEPRTPTNLGSEPPPTSGQNPGPPPTSGQNPGPPPTSGQNPHQPRVRTQDPHRPRVRTPTDLGSEPPPTSGQYPHQPRVRTQNHTDLGSEPRAQSRTSAPDPSALCWLSVGSLEAAVVSPFAGPSLLMGLNPLPSVPLVSSLWETTLSAEAPCWDGRDLVSRHSYGLPSPKEIEFPEHYFTLLCHSMKPAIPYPLFIQAIPKSGLV
ncbi:unnamed protein product [Arctogadus glacialis]